MNITRTSAQTIYSDPARARWSGARSGGITSDQFINLNFFFFYKYSTVSCIIDKIS